MRIVALVGADGSGKSTQAKRLAERLESSGHRTRRVRPLFLLFDPWRLRSSGHPGLSPRHARLREYANSGKVRRTTSVFRTTAGYLYAILSYAYLRFALRDAEYVVCDRYFYQFFFDLAGASGARFARSFPRPNVAYWLDAPKETLRTRLEKLPNGHETAEYLDAVTWYYRSVAADLGFIRIDASAAERTVEETIWTKLMREVGRSPT